MHGPANYNTAGSSLLKGFLTRVQLLPTAGAAAAAFTKGLLGTTAGAAEGGGGLTALGSLTETSAGIEGLQRASKSNSNS